MSEAILSCNQDATETDTTDRSMINEMLDHLVSNKDAYFKSQQRGENDLSTEQKREIASNILSGSKANFLSRFGKCIKEEHLQYFQKFTTDAVEGYDVKFYLANLKRHFSKTKRDMDIKNRRYSALNKLVEDNNYFTETEMMRRNPLLYDQLVGQYMSSEEKKKRDNIDTKNITFVNLLLEGIDREAIRTKRKKQQDDEDNVVEEEEDDDDYDDMSVSNDLTNEKVESDGEWTVPAASTMKWGEFEGSEEKINLPNTSWAIREVTPPKEIVMITASERRLLKEEFVSIMYQDFIDGKDTDFDYSTVDNNEEYDNLDIKNLDAEEKYFDSESPEESATVDKMAVDSQVSSEDELDVFMNRLKQHHSIKELSKNMSNL